MQIEIDQSNKVERTDKDTVIGLSNSESFSVLIKKHTKRKLQEEFRKRGKPKIFCFRVFMAGIALAFKYSEMKDATKIIIDKEYPGREKFLRAVFLEMSSKYFDNVPVIEFKSIGKRSNAHAVCYNAMRGKTKTNKVLSFEEIERVVFK